MSINMRVSHDEFQLIVRIDLTHFVTTLGILFFFFEDIQSRAHKSLEFAIPKYPFSHFVMSWHYAEIIYIN